MVMAENRDRTQVAGGKVSCKGSEKALSEDADRTEPEVACVRGRQRSAPEVFSFRLCLMVLSFSAGRHCRQEKSGESPTKIPA